MDAMVENKKNVMTGGRRTRRAGRGRGRRAGTRKNQMGGAHERKRGTHAEVWHGTAHHTTGGLTKSDLMKNKHGRIVSKKKHALGKKALKHLVKAGFKAKKGTFKLFRK
jgi:hypothetical protein